MPIGILDPNAGMIAPPWWQGQSVTTDSGGRRINGARVLDAGGVRSVGGGLLFDAADWDAGYLRNFAQNVGLGDLWERGYSQEADWSREGSTGQMSDIYSEELLQALSPYEFIRLGHMEGQGDRTRQLAAINRQTGQVVWGSDPYSYSHWTEAPIEGAVVLGSAALLGGGIPGIPGIGSFLPGAEVGAAAATTSGATNPALIESAVGSAGYGASSAGPGGILGGAGVSMGEALGGLPSAAGGGMEAGGALSGGAGAGAGTGAAAGGGLLGNIGGAASGALDWLRANPTIARGLFSLGGSLLSGGLGGNSGGSGQQTYGPPRQWSSPLQTGLLTTPQQEEVNPVNFRGRW